MGLEAGLIWLALHKALSSEPEVLRKIGNAFGDDAGRLTELNESRVGSLLGAHASSVSAALTQVEDAREDWEDISERGVAVVPFPDT